MGVSVSRVVKHVLTLQCWAFGKALHEWRQLGCLVKATRWILFDLNF